MKPRLTKVKSDMMLLLQCDGPAIKAAAVLENSARSYFDSGEKTKDIN